MKNRTKIILVIILTIVLVALGVKVYSIEKCKGSCKVIGEELSNEDVKVEDLKEETGATGNEEIYEVSEDTNGRKVLHVKQSLEYKVALAGVLSSVAPAFETVDSIIEKAPTQNGIWINDRSRSSFLSMLNEITEGEYSVNDDGYLTVERNGNNKMDTSIQNLINGQKQYLIDIKGSNYIVDQMTGKIQEEPFEEMEPEQSYQYYENFENGDKMVVIFTTNKEKILSNQEIIESFLELVNS